MDQIAMVLMYFYEEARLDNVLDRALYWLHMPHLKYVAECFAWNEV